MSRILSTQEPCNMQVADMLAEGEAIRLQLLRQIQEVPAKSANAFAYLTQFIKNSFLKTHSTELDSGYQRLLVAEHQGQQFGSTVRRDLNRGNEILQNWNNTKAAKSEAAKAVRMLRDAA